MEFRILGPLEVVDDGRAVGLGGARPRALLAILLLRRNEVVPAERLREDLYGAEQPVTGAKSLQAHISRLRKALGPNRVHTRGGGYGLEVAPDEVDADRFADQLGAGRSALAAGKAASAEHSFMEALALWRGPPLTDFAYQEFAQAEITRLEELRLACLEELFEARLALARHSETVGELERLVAEHPLRERLRGQLMLALYRDGRQAEALRAYQAARRALVEGLGIEPGPGCASFTTRSCSRTPRSSASATLAAQPSRGAFVGREKELGQLLAELDEAASGRGRLVLVAGEPGIGKSRLAEELIAHARARGTQVLVGRCWEAGGAPAYWPWVQALRTYTRGVEPERAAGTARRRCFRSRPAVARAARLFPDLPEPPRLESEGARFRLFEAVSRFLTDRRDAPPGRARPRRPACRRPFVSADASFRGAGDAGQPVTGRRPVPRRRPDVARPAGLDPGRAPAGAACPSGHRRRTDCSRRRRIHRADSRNPPHVGGGRDDPRRDGGQSALPGRSRASARHRAPARRARIAPAYPTRRTCSDRAADSSAFQGLPGPSRRGSGPWPGVRPGGTRATYPAHTRGGSPDPRRGDGRACRG